jgi:WD40 repeat protein
MKVCADDPSLFFSFVLIFLSGPVRGVAIHPSRALLVTGGDDYKIKVWGERDIEAFVSLI